MTNFQYIVWYTGEILKVIICVKKTKKIFFAADVSHLDQFNDET